MNKTMKIDLTVREWFAISQSDMGCKARRKIFGTFGLTKKIWTQLAEQVSPADIITLKNEWKKIKLPINPNLATKPADRPVRAQTRVWNKKDEASK
jgi:hypothetical protein